jgi:hypothetical protein
MPLSGGQPLNSCGGDVAPTRSSTCRNRSNSSRANTFISSLVDDGGISVHPVSWLDNVTFNNLRSPDSRDVDRELTIRCTHNVPPKTHDFLPLYELISIDISLASVKSVHLLSSLTCSRDIGGPFERNDFPEDIVAHRRRVTIILASSNAH